MSELSKSYMINRIAELVEENAALRESQSSTHKTMMQLNDSLVDKKAELKELRKIVKDQEIEIQKYKIQDTIGLSDFIDKNVKRLTIAKLVQVKEKAEDVLDDALHNCSMNESYYDKLFDFIDNLINELRGNK